VMVGRRDIGDIGVGATARAVGPLEDQTQRQGYDQENLELVPEY
jgi:hypothetical protein